MTAASARRWIADMERMLADIRSHGFRDERVLEAMKRVPRHRFLPRIPPDCDPYGDYPISIGHGQTISQPFIVAHMTSLLDVHPGMNVLDIGTGSGYQAAILAALSARVCSVERIPELADHARRTLACLGFESVRVHTGDGTLGWPEEAPFDRILAACAASRLPPLLLDQLAEEGRLLLPLGAGPQRLVLFRKQGDTVERHDDVWVRFVPMILPP